MRHALDSNLSAMADLAIFRGVNFNSGADPADMVSLRMHITHNRIITLRKHHIFSIDQLSSELESGRAPKSSGEFLVRITELMTIRMGAMIGELDEQPDDLEEQVAVGKVEQLRNQLSDLRRTLIRMRRFLSPQRDALNRIISSRSDWMSKNDLMWLREVTNDTIRYLEVLDAARDRAQITHEELSQQLSEEAGNRMYLLSIVTAIFLPLGFLTGLLGINVGGIPGADNPLGFAIVCGDLR